MKIEEILTKFKKNEISLEETLKSIKMSAIAEIDDIAKIDLNREIRSGVPEMVLARWKTPEDVVQIVKKSLDAQNVILVTCATEKHVWALKSLKEFDLEINERAKAIVVKRKGYEISKTGGNIAVICAGTSDIPIAEEAKIIAELMGCNVFTYYDVGIAGIHRMFNALKDIYEHDVDVIISVAGMEGALPSVVASMVDIPVIGVPVSVGYGYGGEGQAALMSMLQSCVPGLSVVNIDNGIGAGSMAALIANRVAQYRSKAK